MLFVAAIALAYLFGAYSFALDLWPIRQIRNAKRATQGCGDIVIHFDGLGRLVDYPGNRQSPARPRTRAPQCP